MPSGKRLGVMSPLGVSWIDLLVGLQIANSLATLRCERTIFSVSAKISGKRAQLPAGRNRKDAVRDAPTTNLT
jgi:hypothetical protein